MYLVNQMYPKEIVMYRDSQKKPSIVVHLVINEENVVICTLVPEIANGKWKEREMAQVCPLIKEWKVEYLWLSTILLI